MSTGFYPRYGKRCFDALSACVSLMVLSPLFVIVGLLVKLSSPGPVFFKQSRVGQFGQPFPMLKFRSMRVVSAEQKAKGALLTAAGDPRITAIGVWLRRTKIDELPQLINVLRGDMSLVGPRPEVSVYVAKYNEKQRQVLQAKPGITGRTAVEYIGEEELLAGQADKEGFYVSTIMPAKLAIDLAYCRDIRFAEDLRLIFATFAKIFSRNAEMRKPSPSSSS